MDIVTPIRLRDPHWLWYWISIYCESWEFSTSTYFKIKFIVNKNTDQGYQQVPCKFTPPTWYFIYWSDIGSFTTEARTYVCINHFLMITLINFVKALPQLPTTTTMIIINNIIIMRSPHEPQLGYPLLSNVAGLICFSVVGGGCVRLISINDHHHHCPR